MFFPLAKRQNECNGIQKHGIQAYTAHMVLNEHVQCNIILDCIELKIMLLHIVYYLLDPIWAHSKNEWSQVKKVPH